MIKVPLETLEAYKSGSLNPDQLALLKSGIDSGDLVLPEGESLDIAPQAEQQVQPQGIIVPPETIRAYTQGGMNEEQRRLFEEGVQSGDLIVQNVDAALAPPPEEPSLIDAMTKSVKEAITGEQRTTPEVEAAESWHFMPEHTALSNFFKGISLTGATLFTSAEETAKIVKENYPDVDVREDAKGNLIFTSGIDGKDYVVKPGFKSTDVARVATALPMLSKTAGKTLMGTLARTLGFSTGQQTAEAVAGGDFDPEDVAIDVAMPIAGKVLSKGAKSASDVVTKPFRQADDLAAKNIDEAVQSVDLGQRAAKVDTSIQTRPDVEPKKFKVEFDDEIEELTDDQIAKLMRGAADGNQKDIEKIVQISEFNPEAVKSAERLGLDLPMDVFSDSQKVRISAGLSRAQSASAEGAFNEAVEKAAQQADEALNDLGTATFEGRVSLDQASLNIKEKLDNLESIYKQDASNLFERVKASFSELDEATFDNVKAQLDEVTKGRVEAGLPKEIRDLVKLFKEPGLTYKELEAQKRQIFQAMTQKTGLYKEIDTKVLSDLYDGFKKDQLENVRRLGGDDAARDIKRANFLTSQYKDYQDKIVQAFGKEGKGSIAGKLKAAIKQGKEGDSTQFNKIIEAIPKPLRKEALLTALSSSSRATAGQAATERGFGFTNYAKIYAGIRDNPTIYKTIAKELGPEGRQLLDDIYRISKYVSTAVGNVSKTGKSALPTIEKIEKSINAEGFVENMLNTKWGGRIDKGTGGKASDWFGDSPAKRMEALGKVFNDKKTRDVVAELKIKGEASEPKIKAMAESMTFKRWLKETGMDYLKTLDDRENYIKDLIKRTDKPEEE